jgi:transcriptional regulator with XRE-family HTH domain
VSESKVPNPIDKHVGSRVRMRRLMLSMSQGKLGDALGITFQQVQKYEKGANRIGAGRMQQIAHVLQVPVGFFFEGASDGSVLGKSEEGTRSVALLDDFVSSPEGLRLVQAFLRVENPEVRRRIVALVQEIASHDRFEEE